MQILCRFCLLIVVCSVRELYKKVFPIFMNFFVMEIASCLNFLTQSSGFGCGFLVFGCFSQVFNLLGPFFIFALGFNFLRFSFHGKGLVQYLCDIRGKSSDMGNGFCSKNDFFECDEKNLICKSGSVKLLERKSRNMDNTIIHTNIDFKEKDILEENDDEYDNGRGNCDEDEEFDVIALRKLVEIERRRANAAYAELEKERMAAASAADEAMAMILRLQREKSSIEIKSNQYWRMAEQKQEYDQEVIQSLQWIVTKHEHERSLLEEQLKFCMQKLKMHMKDDEIDQFEGVDASLSLFNYAMEDEMEEGMLS